VNPAGYIAIFLALLALILWVIYRMDRAESRRQYRLAVEAEELRRIEAGRKLYEAARLDRRD